LTLIPLTHPPSLPILLLCLPPPPTPTLFPYTTLFRSRREADPDRAQARRQRVHRQERQSHRPPVGAAPGGRGHRLQRDRPARRGDRKSTRLNSSHVSISYAVFCLKKKNKKK